MKLDSNVYQELVRNIDIIGISLKELKVENLSSSNQKDIEISVKHKSSPSYEKEGDLLKVFSVFEVSGKTNNQTEFVINFILQLDYKLDAKFSIEDQYIKFFIQNNVPVNAWPYARELVSNMTLRMGLSPLILPVMRV